MLLITVLFSIMLTDDKLIIDMFYSDNHVEVSLDAFLASEEYAKESIKDVELVFDQNADRSIKKQAYGLLKDNSGDWEKSSRNSFLPGTQAFS